MATNIYNGPNGSITVGADGILEMYGKNITNYNSILVAGDLTGNDPYDETPLTRLPTRSLRRRAGRSCSITLPRLPPFLTCGGASPIKQHLHIYSVFWASAMGCCQPSMSQDARPARA